LGSGADESARLSPGDPLCCRAMADDLDLTELRERVRALDLRVSELGRHL
jgi:hypothetical protein